MNVAEFDKSPNADRLVRQIAAHDLATHIVDLAAYGFTVVPPEKLSWPDGLVARIRNGVIAAHERRGDLKIGDPERYDGPNPLARCGDIWWLIDEPGVVDSLLNPVVLTLARWLLGNSATLSGSAYLLKSRSDADDATSHTMLHTDAHGVPCPTSTVADACNTSLLLSDYRDLDDGLTVVLPGSHLFGRPPNAVESRFWEKTAPYDLDRMVPIRGPAGSLAVWHGNLWHGALPRRRPGLRTTLVHYWVRSHLRIINDFRGQVSDATVARHPELARILGLHHCYPWRTSMDTGKSLVDLMARGADPFA